MAGGKLISTGVEFPDATTQTTSGLPLTGGTMTGDVSLGDNVKATFGAGDDLQIYHDGSKSIISDNGSGNLYIYSDQFIINNYPDTQNMARFVSGGAATLYHAGSAKLATTSTGIDVTGSVTCDGFTSTGIDDNATSTAITIASSGNTFIGGTTENQEGAFTIRPNTSNGSCMIQMNRATTTATSNALVFYDGGAGVGAITYTDTATAYGTSSDYRLKENVVPMTGSIDRLKALKPSKFNFIRNPLKTVDGFLAHEAGNVVPECVIGTKDAMMDEEYEVTPAVMDGDTVVTEAVMGTRSVPDYQGIDQSKLVPLLVASLQEAVAKIEALEARVTALEV